MDNNNGRGIFYGVIGVATLVVAIIGATFAYFSASISSDENAITTNTTVLELTYTEGAQNMRSDLIPVNAIGNESVFKVYPGVDTTKTSGKGTCRDDVGNSICSVYSFTIGNPSDTVAQTVSGSLKVTANTTTGTEAMPGEGFKNLYYAVFKGLPSEFTNYDLSLSPVRTDSTSAKAGDLIVGPTKITAVGSDDHAWEFTQEQLENKTTNKSTTSYTVVVWLEENGDENNSEQGGMFTAQITFDTGNDVGVTGTIGSAT